MTGSGFEIMIKLSVSLGLLAVAFLMALTAVMNAVRHGQRIEERLSGGAGSDISEAPARVGLLEAFGSHLSLPGPEEITRQRAALARAGFYAPGAVKTYYAARLLAIVVPVMAVLVFMGPLTAWLGPPKTLFMIAVLVGIGTLGPDQYVRWRQSRRRQACQEGFPDMMDLLVASIEAGLGMDAALIRVAQELGNRYPDLKIDLDLMNLELRAGRDRQSALVNFAERVDLEEARALGVMIKQAEEMGSSLGKSLRAFSEDMREKRMLRAEEKAMALSAKLTVPLILFIFPTLMVILMLPAVIRVAEQFGA